MNKAATKPDSTRSRFSVGWCVAAAASHLVVTVAFAGISFVADMGAFTANGYEAQRIHSAINFWSCVQWFWTPLATAAWDRGASIRAGLLVTLALTWSCIVGAIVGFLVPSFLRWLHKPLQPPVTLNDNTHSA